MTLQKHHRSNPSAGRQAYDASADSGKLPEIEHDQGSEELVG